MSETPQQRAAREAADAAERAANAAQAAEYTRRIHGFEAVIQRAEKTR